jgi:hypothetical protein
MASVVPTLFFPGGKSLTRPELDQVCQILDITDPLKSLLPVGDACTYYLLLSTNSPLPQSCADLQKPLMRIVGKKAY